MRWFKNINTAPKRPLGGYAVVAQVDGLVFHVAYHEYPSDCGMDTPGYWHLADGAMVADNSDLFGDAGMVPDDAVWALVPLGSGSVICEPVIAFDFLPHEYEIEKASTSELLRIVKAYEGYMRGGEFVHDTLGLVDAQAQIHTIYRVLLSRNPL